MRDIELSARAKLCDKDAERQIVRASREIESLNQDTTPLPMYYEQTLMQQQDLQTMVKSISYENEDLVEHLVSRAHSDCINTDINEILEPDLT